jgi:predicted nucleic acid-binding protein
VTWDGWCAINKAELEAGEARGKRRSKLCTVPDLLAAAQACADAMPVVK